MPQYKNELIKFIPSQNSLEVFATSEPGQQLIHSLDRTLIWLSLFQKTYKGQPGVILLASAHSKIIELWVLVPLRLLHSASGSLRTILDMIFSYSFYVYHSKEWNAILSGRSGWEGRMNVFNWHLRFTPCFQEYSEKFGIGPMMDDLYRDLSGFIHGIPTQGLPTMQSLDRNELDKIDITPVIQLAQRVDNCLNLFLVGAFHSLLPILSPSDYKIVLAQIDKSKLANCGIIIPSP